MIINLRSLITSFLFVALAGLAKAQSLPVGTPALEDYYRRAQLLGVIDSNVSFTIRPLYPVNQFRALSPYNTEPSGDNYKPTPSTSWTLPELKGSGFLLPITLLTQFNSDHPYGWNEGVMIPAKGLQTYLSVGLYAKFGPLSIQLQPEFVTAANSDFDDFNKNHYGVTVARYYDFYNTIELPTRFGIGNYTHAFWGQSSVRLNYKGLSFGVSAENLWWGPGMRNSLIMTNDAPGFVHLTLNTLKPLKTAIGSFEGQLIAGTLQNSNLPPLTPNRQYFESDLYVPKTDLSRHISGLVITWQPKWVTGLFLGLTRSSQLYDKDVKGLGDYLPFFSEFASITANAPVYQTKDYRSSIFARWLWPSEHAEVYFEYGHNHNYTTLSDASLQPQENRAYIVGLRKMFPFNAARNESLVLSVEETELAETSIDKILNTESWYTNKYITQGYTNMGQSLGAGIGPGGNLQTLDISWVRGIKKIGLQFERYVHNDDLYYYLYLDSKDYRRHWVDLSVAANGAWNYKNLVFSATLQYIRSNDYQYYLNPSLEAVGQAYFVNGKTANNLHAQFGISYRF